MHCKNLYVKKTNNLERRNILCRAHIPVKIFCIIFTMILYVRTRRKKRQKGSGYINESNDKMHTSIYPRSINLAPTCA